MRTLTTSFVLGYHGCRREVGEGLLSGDDFRSSDNDYDWLGPGIYFWEANPKRGLDFFKEKLARASTGSSKKADEPFVIGAVIELGNCLDLNSTNGVSYLSDAYTSLQETMAAAERDLPINHDDLLRRNLDCAVVRRLHTVQKVLKQPDFDTVRSVFIEGEPIYPTSGFHSKTHIQICVCTVSMIKGVFRVPKTHLK